MTKKIGIVLGVYAIIAFVVFLLQLVAKLEDGLRTGDAFSAGMGAGAIWPVRWVALFMNGTPPPPSVRPGAAERSAIEAPPLVPGAGFEPATSGLQNQRSTN